MKPHHCSPCIRRPAGFTLIEVMIVVAIISILAAMAFPSYLESVRKSRRAEARSQLLEASQFMQRFYSQNDRFDKDLDGKDAALPASLAQSPRQGPAAYNISFVAAAPLPSSFALEAVPTGNMAGDRCGTLQLNSAGRRSIVDAAAGMTTEDCWR